MFMACWILNFLVRAYSESWANNEASGKSYFVNNVEINWSDAQSACEVRESRLAVIVDVIDFNFIERLDDRISQQYWIGLQKGSLSCGCSGSDIPPCVDTPECVECRKSWTWVDNTEMGSYLPWTCNRPLGNRACGVIRPGATFWDATSCSNERRSICQYDCSSVGCMRSDCQLNNNIYSCTCIAGYTGLHCDQDKDECDSDPCLNGGTCMDQINSYTCICVLGYVGDHCETDINECVPNPCINAIECLDKVNNYTCTCNPGYTGHMCETDIDECSSEPCQNDGICINQINQYECNCTNIYDGINCDHDVESLSTTTETTNVLGSQSEEQNDDHTVQNAFYSGVTLLSVAFIGMIITIVIFIKTKPKRNTPVISLGHDGIENGSASADQAEFDSI